MPEHNGFTREQVDAGRNLVDAQLSAFAALVDAVDSEAPDGTIETTVGDIEGGYFNTLAIALDRVLGDVTRKGSRREESALNEFELIVESLLTGTGVFRGNQSLGYVVAHSATGLAEGDTIALNADGFERLTDAVFGELEKKLAK